MGFGTTGRVPAQRWGTRLRAYAPTLGCLVAGLVILSFLIPESAAAFESAKFAIREICGHMQGKLGGLLMTVAGIGGLTAAAFGNMRASQSLLVVGIGAFAISGILSIYFEDAAGECATGNGNARTIDRQARDANPFKAVEADLAAGRVGNATTSGRTLGAPPIFGTPGLEYSNGEEPFQAFDEDSQEIAEDF